jgi:hypothetical protein
LGVEDGQEPSNPSAAAFAAWNNEPPAAPTLKSDGVVATDITEAFTHAAQRMSCSTISSKKESRVDGN